MNDMKKTLVDQDIYDDILSGTNMIAGNEFKTIMCTISQFCSDVVVKTLGPYGSTTLLDDGQGFIYPTKDGWSGLNKIRFNDPIYNTALNTLRKTSFDAVTGAGDGTTTAMVASNAFLQYIMNSDIVHEQGFNQALFRKCVETAAEDVINQLRERATDITHDDAGVDIIRQIATIATNGNSEYGEMIADIYKKTMNPDIHVRIGDEADTTYEIEEGYRAEAHILGFPAFANTDDKRYIEKKAKIMIFNHNVTYTNDWNFLSNVIAYCNENRFKLVILAPYFDEMITNWYSRNVQKTQQQGTVPLIVFCQVPATTALQKLALTDLEMLTNASIVDAEKITMFDNLVEYQKDPEHGHGNLEIAKMAESLYGHPQAIIESAIGTAGRLEFTEKSLFLMEYEEYANMKNLAQAQADAKENWETMRKKMNRVASGNLNKDYMTAHQRYVRLMGKMGSIIVGGVNDLQKVCDKDAIDDACLACRSAWDAGYISGMNLDTIRSIKYLIKNFATMEVTRTKSTPDSRYYLFALDALHVAFMTVAQAVLSNKCPDGVRQEVLFDDNSIAHMTNKEILFLLTEGQTTWTRKPKDVLSATDKPAECDKIGEDKQCFIKAPIDGPERYSYDLRNGWMHTMDCKDAIINSVEMDIQIIRSTVAVLTMVITSSQFLSTGRMYDRKLTRTQQKQKMCDEYVDKGASFMHGILLTLNHPENKEKVDTLRDVLTGISTIPPVRTYTPLTERFGVSPNGFETAEYHGGEVMPSGLEEPDTSSDKVTEYTSEGVLSVYDTQDDFDKLIHPEKQPNVPGFDSIN